MNLSELQRLVHETAVSKGWHDHDELDATGKPTARQKLAWLALVTDELDEAEAEDELVYFDAKGKPEGKLVEIADAIIRLFDWAGAMGYDIIKPGNGLSHADSAIPEKRSALVSMIRDGRSMTECDGMADLLVALIGEFHGRRSTASNPELLGTIETIVELKNAYNNTRSYRHGGKLA